MPRTQGSSWKESSYDELWKMMSIIPDGDEKDILIRHILIRAESTDDYWEIFWATNDESVQDIALASILTMTHDLDCVRQVIQYATPNVERFANLVFDLAALEHLSLPSTTNKTRFGIADTTSSWMCKQHALREVVRSNPTSSELWEVFNHPAFPRDLIEHVEYLLRVTEVTE